MQDNLVSAMFKEKTPPRQADKEGEAGNVNLAEAKRRMDNLAEALNELGDLIKVLDDLIGIAVKSL